LVNIPGSLYKVCSCKIVSVQLNILGR